MSKSYHVTYRDLKGKTRAEIEEMENDPDSILHKLVEKKSAKRAIKKQRKIKKR